MSATSAFAVAAVGRAQRMSTRVVFFIAGFVMSAWAPMVPLAKARIGLDDGTLGLLLLGLGGGSILAMPFAGYLTAHRGCRWTMVRSALLLCLLLPVLAGAPSIAWLAVGLVLFGACMGLLDCAMNIQAVLVEKASDDAVMSGFHGMYSVGGIAGAAGMTALLSLGMAPLPASLIVVAIVLAALWQAAGAFLRHGSERDGPLFAMPRGIVLFLGVLCFIVFLTEGAMLDWSAVFLVSVRSMDPALAGLGYAAFAVTMTIGRLTGDVLVNRLGGVRIVLLGGACAAAGLAIALLLPGWPAALVGFALVGAGCSNIVPVLFSAVGRQQRMPQSSAIPAMVSLGYAGILLGPATIGFLAHWIDLSWALGSLVLLLLFVSASARYLR
ncbi:MFS transporter [Pseudomonas sp. RIT-PI-S]|uniref:MFS transporter n=1 Tax=Pseudomonas sp. RIT-PI-S TaxID=3035295 RepID=UPI0021DA7D67|nr:MFS transporter [Pseudomonas sp. RIT-PI-S]